MTKKLLVQIKNEWRNNLWLALELLVVSVVMWYVVDYLYTRAATYLEPRGFNIENCYLIELGELTPKSPDYIADRKSEDTHNDIAELVERLRRRPEVEAVSLSQNSYPYNGSNSSGEVKIDTLNSPGWTIRRMVTPDFVRVFRFCLDIHNQRNPLPCRLLPECLPEFRLPSNKSVYDLEDGEQLHPGSDTSLHAIHQPPARRLHNHPDPVLRFHLHV